MHILFSIVSPRRQLVVGPVATPTPLNRASISCSFLIGRYLTFADSAFAQPCYRADNNSILMSTRIDLRHASKRFSCTRRNEMFWRKGLNTCGRKKLKRNNASPITLISCLRLSSVSQKPFSSLLLLRELIRICIIHTRMILNSALLRTRSGKLAISSRERAIVPPVKGGSPLSAAQRDARTSAYFRILRRR